MSEEIAPCPFCAKVGLDFAKGSTYRWRTAWCVGCGASTGEERIQTGGAGTPEEWEADVRRRLIATWNRRARLPSAVPPEEIGRRMAERVFADRKGHGGAPVSFINLRQDELAAFLAAACALALSAPVTCGGSHDFGSSDPKSLQSQD